MNVTRSCLCGAQESSLCSRRCCPRVAHCTSARKYHPVRRGSVLAFYLALGFVAGALVSGRAGWFHHFTGTPSPHGARSDRLTAKTQIDASSSPLLATLPPSNLATQSRPVHTEAPATSAAATTNRPEMSTTHASTDSRPLATLWETVKKSLKSERPSSPENSMKRLRKVSLYVLVKSGPRNVERRQTCRETWQLRGVDKKVVINGLLAQFFLIGKVLDEKGAAVNSAVLNEAKEKGDILLYPGNDTYRRLPWKVLWGFSHALRTYNFDFMLLCDDDSFVNYPQVFKWIARQPMKALYAGHLVSMEPAVQRDVKNPWYVSRERWPEDHYPPYHWGAGYFLSHDLVNASLVEATYHDILWIDDVFIGVLLNATGVPLHLFDVPVYAQPDWKIFLCCEASPLVLGSRPVRKMRMLGKKQSENQPLCRIRRRKYCMRLESE